MRLCKDWQLSRTDVATQGFRKDLTIGRREGGRLARRQRATLAGSHVMQDKWVFSSTFLPYTGEPIEFMLEDRNQSIHGTFADGAFHSRWADYDVDRVQSWRESDGDPSSEAMEMPVVAREGGFITTLLRLTSILSGGRSAAAIAPLRSHARTTTAPPIAMRPIVVAARRIDSNQISS